MLKYSQAQVVVPNTYASILKKLMKIVMLLFKLMDQASWSQKQDSSTIFKLRLQKLENIKIERNIKKGSRNMYKSYGNASCDIKISGGHDKPQIDSILNISIGDTSGYYSILWYRD